MQVREEVVLDTLCAQPVGGVQAEVGRGALLDRWHSELPELRAGVTSTLQGTSLQPGHPATLMDVCGTGRNQTAGLGQPH